MILTPEFKENVVAAIMQQRANYDGRDAGFAKSIGINNSVFSRLKNGERDGLLRDTQYLNIGRELDVPLNERKWNIVCTEVYQEIEEDILFCKENAKSRIMADECGIGKTVAAKHLSRKLKNCFYVDGSQAKNKILLIRLIAKTIGIDSFGKVAEVKANIKYYLKSLPDPIVIIDEFGDLDYNALLEVKEMWNGTENACAWYMIGADGLKAKMNRGMRNKKVGFNELFSRFSDKYTTVVPIGKDDKVDFYRTLITAVLSANMTDKKAIPVLVKKCLTADETGRISGLRRAESLAIIYKNMK